MCLYKGISLFYADKSRVCNVMKPLNLKELCKIVEMQYGYQMNTCMNGKLWNMLSTFLYKRLENNGMVCSAS